jgi:hypothetical protein
MNALVRIARIEGAFLDARILPNGVLRDKKGRFAAASSV